MNVETRDKYVTDLISQLGHAAGDPDRVADVFLTWGSSLGPDDFRNVAAFALRDTYGLHLRRGPIKPGATVFHHEEPV